jgi:hypothetical protein
MVRENWLLKSILDHKITIIKWNFEQLRFNDEQDKNKLKVILDSYFDPETKNSLIQNLILTPANNEVEKNNDSNKNLNTETAASDVLKIIDSTYDHIVLWKNVEFSCFLRDKSALLRKNPYFISLWDDILEVCNIWRNSDDTILIYLCNVSSIVDYLSNSFDKELLSFNEKFVIRLQSISGSNQMSDVKISFLITKKIDINKWFDWLWLYLYLNINNQLKYIKVTWQIDVMLEMLKKIAPNYKSLHEVVKMKTTL